MTDEKKLFEGNATIKEVEFVEPKEYQIKDMSEEDAASAFNVKLTLQPSDDSFQECSVEIEMSRRECKGKLAGKMQWDVSMDLLKFHKLIDGEDISTVCNAVGKVLPIYQKLSADGKYVNTNISRGAAKLSRDEMMKRLAALTGKKPTETVVDPF